MNIVNIGIVAYVDAGKTTLTERILFETNVITKIGRVDHGNTQTDSLELEKRRGITIKASVVSFFVGEQKVNLIDTPGHADFIAEVERSFRVLDGAILVISAVEGIQAQTKFLMAILKQLHIPTIIFINKIDRTGAQAESLIGVTQLLAGVSAFFPANRPADDASVSAVVFKIEREAAGEKIAYIRPILASDTFLLTGTLPAATTEAFKRDLYAFAGGEGLFITRPAGYRKIELPFPMRKRADCNPLNRKEYLFNVGR